MTEIKLSVIVPVYNAGKYLATCLDSLVAQPETDMEIILVDDGSTDNSAEICDGYAAADKRITVIHQANKGVSAARNKGLDTATGKWVAFADADDFYLPDAFAALLGVTSDDVDMVVGASIRLIGARYFTECDFRAAEFTDPLDAISHYALWGYIFRREIIESNAIRFDSELRYSEDRLFIFRVALACRKLVTIPQRVYCYRIHPASACQSAEHLSVIEMQLCAVDKISQLADAVSDSTKLQRECDLIVRFSVEKAFISSFKVKLLDPIWVLLMKHKISYFSSYRQFVMFCIASSLRGLKRRWIGDKRKETAL